MKKHRSNTKDELDLLLQDMNDEASYPDSKFELNLKSKVLSKFKQEKTFSFAELFNFHNVGLVLGVFALFACFTSVGALGGLFYSSSTQKASTAENVASFTDKQKEEFLANVIKNNTENVLNKELTKQSNAQLPSTSKSSVADTSAKEPVVLSYDRAYNYSHTEFKTTSGASAELCPAFARKEEETIDNYFFLDNEDEKSYYKSVTTDKSGELKSYSLWNDEGSYYFLGGGFAARKSTQKVNVQPQIVADSETAVSTEESDLIESYFGKGAKIEKDGVGTYIIVWESSIDCKDDSSDASTTNIVTTPEPSKLVYRSFVKIDNFEITKEEVYLDSVSTENLLTSYEAKTEKSNEAFDDVKRDFQFEYDVEVREFGSVVRTEADQVDDLTSFLASKSIKVLLPKTEGYELTAAYLTSSLNLGIDSYLLDRAFYPEGDSGDEALEQAEELQSQYDYTKNQVMSYIYEKDDKKGVAVSYYKNDTADDEILKWFGSSDFEKKDKSEVSIGQTTLESKIYRIAPEKDPTNNSEVNCEESECEYNIALIIPFGGYKIAVLGYSLSNTEIDELKSFTVLDSIKDADMGILRDKIEETLNNTKTDTESN